MPWETQFTPAPKTAYQAINEVGDRPPVAMSKVDLAKVVAIDFETYWDTDYTLKKLSTSEYIRDTRFKAHMCSIKVGRRKTVVVPHKGIQAAFDKIDWTTHGLLAHNTAFDGLICSHHYGVVPAFYYDTLSMARGLHSNDIGAGLDEVAQYYGVGNKIAGVLDESKGVRDLPRELYRRMAAYCAGDDDLCHAIFKLMLEQFPQAELELVDKIIRMFCDPILTIDRPRVAAEHAKEVAHKKNLILSVLTDADRSKGTEDEQIARGKKVIGSRDGYVALLKAEGIEPPTKLNKDGKTIYAFAKTDIEFQALAEHPEERVRDLVEARLGVRSSINETRAARFLEATRDGHRLPVGYAYYRAHTGRLGGNNKMNMQNLQRGGELRKSIRAPKGWVMPVADSGQIEARVNAWLWGQDDLLGEFAAKDRGLGTDPYCNFAELIYNRPITSADFIERFVGKTCILGLGFQMGAAKLQHTLATGGSGGMGPKVFLTLEQCYEIVNTYRRKNDRIKWGWKFCQDTILEAMYTGRTGQWKSLHWEKERIWLPNGMCLKYPGLRPHRHEDSPFVDWTYEAKDNVKKIYGGLLCENIVQALARIIITGQLLEIAKKDRIVMMTHDENVALAKAARGKAALARMIKIMSVPPSWCADIPLTAEGSVNEFYSK